MNLTLGFPNPEPDDALGLRRRAGLQASIDKLTARMQEPDSPIRAIRILPAREGEYAEMPAAVPTVLREGLAQRGIERLKRDRDGRIPDRKPRRVGDLLHGRRS